MNCDAAFDVLTRGPFPSGDERADDVVERHLAACHECRQMAEALRPAVGLFHEAIVGADSLSLPGYRGELRPAAENSVQTLDRPARLAAHLPGTAARPPRRSAARTAVMIWPLAAAGLIGMAIGGIGEHLRSRDAVQPAVSHGHAAPAGLPSRAVNRDGQLMLALLNLPAACRNMSDGREQLAGSSQQCCTHCHAAAASATAPRGKFATLTSSCAVCHSDS